MAVYEVRRGDVVLATSTMPNMGYSPELLRRIEADGYRIYVNGKPMRKRTQRQETNTPG